MQPEVLVGLGVVAVLVVGLISQLIPKRMPPLKSFKCARCDLQTLHTRRTAEAWRSGKAKFYCQSCHQKWLQTRPSQEHEFRRTRGSSGRASGCLGGMLLFALVPLGTWAVWAWV